MADLLDLANNLDRIAKNIVTESNELAKKVSKSILITAISETRVDTSRALSNWQLNTGRVENSRLKEGYFKGKFGSTRSISMAAAIEVGLIQLTAKQPGESVHIHNDVVDPDFREHYIRKLNDEDNMVGKAVLMGFIQLKNYKFKTLR